MGRMAGTERKGDAFEAAEMQDGARVVHRDKRLAKRIAGVLAASGLGTMILSIVIALMNGSSSKPLDPSALPFVVGAVALLGAVLAVMGIVFGVLRTVVTERAVHVKFGLWGPTIPIEAITSCKVVDYDWTKFGGWGIRRAADGTWAYVPSSGPVVELMWKDAEGSHRALVGAQDAISTAMEINRAREAAAGSPVSAKVRVEADVEAEDPADADAEASEPEATAKRKA